MFHAGTNWKVTGENDRVPGETHTKELAIEKSEDTRGNSCSKDDDIGFVTRFAHLE